VRISLGVLAVCAALTGLGQALAADTTWTGAAGTDFYANGNWDTNAAPTGADNALILDPTKPAVINFTGSRELGSFHLGQTGATGGNVEFTAGMLVVHADFDRSHIGDKGSADSKFVMRGTATMLFDEPLSGGGAGLGSAGGNQDLEIGAQTGATGNKGVLELHDSAVLRISDDLKIGAEANGDGEVLIDGSARITVGSGLSVSEANPSKGKLTVAGTSLIVTGNSAGAGNTAEGLTDEGYFTLSVNSGSTADVLIKDSGKVYARSLQQRSGTTTMAIQDSGEFHIFDTFAFAAPNLGTSTLIGDPFGPQRASHVAQSNDAVFNLLISGNGKMTVDSALDNGTGLTLQGLSLSSGDNRGNLTGGGGKSLVELRDNASFAIQQDLHMSGLIQGITPVGASSTLRVIGPNVTAQINGDLFMSIDTSIMAANGEESTLNPVITGATHSTIEVGGTANIEFGTLAVELNGYTPHGGESYTLLTAASIAGADFKASDFTLAPLPQGLTWDLDVGATSVVLKVLGSVSQAGDFDADGDVDGNDFLKWQRGESPNPVSASDLASWRANYGAGGATATVGAVPEPATLSLAGALLVALAASRVRRDAETHSPLVPSP
jgi:hypothetical protein